MKFFANVAMQFSHCLSSDLEDFEPLNEATNPNAQRGITTVLRSVTFSVPTVSLMVPAGMVPSGQSVDAQLAKESIGVPLSINERAASGPGILMLLTGPRLGDEPVEFCIALTGQAQYENVEVFTNGFDLEQQWVPEQVKALSLGSDIFLWWHDLYGRCLATAFVAGGTHALARDLEGFAPSLNETWQMLTDQIERMWGLD